MRLPRYIGAAGATLVIAGVFLPAFDDIIQGEKQSLLSAGWLMLLAAALIGLGVAIAVLFLANARPRLRVWLSALALLAVVVSYAAGYYFIGTLVTTSGVMLVGSCLTVASSIWVLADSQKHTSKKT